jgi:hypothetical protein
MLEGEGERERERGGKCLNSKWPSCCWYSQCHAIYRSDLHNLIKFVTVCNALAHIRENDH